MSIDISSFSGEKRNAAIKAVRKANALYFSSASIAEDPRDVLDFIANCLRDEAHIDGTIELHIDGQDSFFMWVNELSFSSVEDWLVLGVLASGNLPRHWRFKIPDGDSAYENVIVKVDKGTAKFEVDLRRPTQRGLDSRELYEALHLE